VELRDHGGGNSIESASSKRRCNWPCAKTVDIT